MDSGYEEIEHTADLELHVWASDMAGLLEQAARGMYSLTETSIAGLPREKRTVIIPITGREIVIVDFLEELLFFMENGGIGFDKFQISKQGERWIIYLEGAPIHECAKEIKAVTFHGIDVRETDSGLEVNIVFDV